MFYERYLKQDLKLKSILEHRQKCHFYFPSHGIISDNFQKQKILRCHSDISIKSFVFDVNPLGKNFNKFSFDIFVF